MECGCSAGRNSLFVEISTRDLEFADSLALPLWRKSWTRHAIASNLNKPGLKLDSTTLTKYQRR